MTSTLLGRTIRDLGAKRAATALGYSLGYTYALARDSADPAHPDYSGTESDPVARIVALLERVSSYPHLRPLLREWDLYFNALMERLLERSGDPAGDDVLIADAAACAKETGEAVSATLIQAVAAGDYSDALREVLEAAEAMDRLARALQRRQDQEATAPLSIRRPA